MGLNIPKYLIRGMLLALGLNLGAAPPGPPAPEERTWMLTFPQVAVDPDFQLVSAELQQTRRHLLPLLEELDGDSGAPAPIGLATVLVAGGNAVLASFLEAHPGLKASFFNLQSGDCIALDGCRLVRSGMVEPADSSLRTLRITYRSIEFIRGEP
jgi:hypothetical protein